MSGAMESPGESQREQDSFWMLIPHRMVGEIYRKPWLDHQILGVPVI